MQLFIFLGCLFFYQVHAVYLVNWWHKPFNFGNANEMISSVRVPVGSDPTHTYWCANGFDRGYMGMQHNDGTDRRFLFSIWDDGKGSQVEPLEVNPDGRNGPFAHEGTGKHTIIHYPWNAGDSVFFRLTADPHPESNYTDFAGYYQINAKESDKWTLIAKYRADKTVMYLTGPYSFLENPSGTDKDILREGFYGNQTLTNTDGKQIKSTMTYESQRTKPGDIWQQQLVDDESYVRMDGLKDQGIYPPTNNS